jgi:hypothetical protein
MHVGRLTFDFGCNLFELGQALNDGNSHGFMQVDQVRWDRLARTHGVHIAGAQAAKGSFFSGENELRFRFSSAETTKSQV